MQSLSSTLTEGLHHRRRNVLTQCGRVNRNAQKRLTLLATITQTPPSQAILGAECYGFDVYSKDWNFAFWTVSHVRKTSLEDLFNVG
jgi:hypothetical protein